VAVIVNYWN